MGTVLHVARRVMRPTVLFSDRADAGRRLAGWIDPKPDSDALVFALPRGGIPVGRPLADALGCRLLPALTRKLPVPGDPEMGFGAVAVDGSVRLNRSVVGALHITTDEVARTVTRVRAEVERRGAVYPGGWPLPDLGGRDVWLVDDGLATGYTMLSAVDMLRAGGPASLTAVVPCSPPDSLSQVARETDATWCLAVQDGRPFAVAAFYRDFHDMDDDEVLSGLRG